MPSHVLHGIVSVALASFLSEPLPLRNPSAARPTAGAVRPTDAKVEWLIQQGCSGSATFRALVDELQSSSWIVFVQSGSCRMPGMFGCLLHQVGTTENRKYLRIVITAQPASHVDVIATIGHELQHAVEVVRDGHVQNNSDLRDLYRRIGYVASRAHTVAIYETPAARTAGSKILQELRSHERARPGRCGH